MTDKVLGLVSINDREVSTAEFDGELRILHAPTGNHCVLDEMGAALWRRLQSGLRDVSELVKEHASSQQIPEVVAAFQVISFLDELRDQHFITFALSSERESAPLLDTPLSDLRPRFIKRLQADSAKGPRRAFVVLETPNEELKLREFREIAERVSNADIQAFKETIIVAALNTELTASGVEEIVTNPTHIEHPNVELLGIVEKPSPGLTLRELTRPFTQPVSSSTFETTPSPRHQVVVIIVTDDVIIIIVSDDGAGPSRGKSRSACKTMCV